MNSLFLFLGIIAFFLFSLTFWNALQRRKGNTKEKKSTPPLVDGGCCGMHEVCERDSLIAAFTKDPEYFDDEELDNFAGKDSSDYTEAEVDEFREIFYTLLDEDKPRWVRSLQVRGIQVPDQLKDEILMVVNDMRVQKMHA